MDQQRWPNLESIKAAHARIKDYIHHTPVLHSSAIDHLAGSQLCFKCENFQKVGAFKARGAANAVLKLSESERKNGVATHSSGNHAAALARAATQIGIPAYIVMPSNAPEIKKAAVRNYGGQIVECEPTLSSRESTLAEVVKKTGATFIHPFNNLDVIEGQATCALELITDQPDLEAVIAPVGGGGLLSGSALTLHYLSPNTKVYAGEPQEADDAFLSFQSGRLQTVDASNTIADGLRTALGEITFGIIRKHVTAILTVTETDILHAMQLAYERLKIVIEPSAAVPLAAILTHKDIFQGQKVGIILSGGNVDLTSLPFR